MNRELIIHNYISSGKRLTKLNGKRPILNDWTNVEVSEADLLSHNGNLGWVLDIGDLVVDVDYRNGGEESFAKLQKDIGIDLTATVKTPSGGFHCYLKIPVEMQNRIYRKTLNMDYPGIDFLTKGSQCVIAGSKTEKGSYEWTDGSLSFKQNTAPLVLTNLISNDTLSEKSEYVAKHNSNPLPKNIEAMLSYISSEDYNTWISVGMALYHETQGSNEAKEIWHHWSKPASTYKDADEIELKWRSFDKPIEHPKRIGTIRKLAYEGGYIEDVTDEFENLASLTPNTEPTHRFQLIQAGRFSTNLQYHWAIKRLLPEVGLAMVYGESGCGKTFFVMDMCLAMATDDTWNKRKIKKINTIAYIAAEGVVGIKKRLMAYSSFYDRGLDEMPFYIIKDSPNLHKDDDIMLIQSLKKQGGVNVIVIDTLAQVTPGANENSAEHMGAALKRCQNLATELNCLVILIHHSGKDATRGSRGWSGLKAAIDTEIEIKKSNKTSVATVTKQKDEEAGENFPFILDSVRIGDDEDGDPVTSCVVKHLDEFVDDSLPKLTGKWQNYVLDAVSSLSLFGDDPIEEATIVKHVITLYEEESGTTKKVRPGSINRAIDDLITKELLERKGGGIALAQKHNSSQSA